MEGVQAFILTIGKTNTNTNAMTYTKMDCKLCIHFCLRRDKYKYKYSNNNNYGLKSCFSVFLDRPYLKLKNTIGDGGSTAL